MEGVRLIEIIIAFFVSFGVIVGGAVIGGIGAFMVGEPPLHTIATLAVRLKIWAIVAAIGGTFDTITNMEKSFLSGTPDQIMKQFMWIFFALGGAQAGMEVIRWLTQEKSI
ncbi:YtrH family sporulation protein [Pseudalkalibacillus caeni]|uniref:Sporulation protein n=1 Tax=Exobacillus caeni TaxID=2574798 RepID=A0A5R9FA50_9BACL|nr:YtrH family sporulation protein [Pseudalkalibacillus caeni]TLS39130.1 sporulation protein [Pseudalkalibacillus caeni]